MSPGASPLSGVHVEERGSGRTLLFVHGWRLDSSTDIADFDPLPSVRQWRRVYIDLPGMGRSAVRNDLRTLSDYAGWLRSAILALSGSERFAVVGTSAGSALVLHALMDGGLPVRGVMCRVPLVVASCEPRSLPEDSLPPWAAGPRAEKLDQLWVPAERRVSEHVLALRADPARYTLDRPRGVLRVPALVVAGRQDSRVGYLGTGVLADVLPRATIAIVDGAEHEYPHGERGLFAALVSDWLRRVEREWDEDVPAR